MKPSRICAGGADGAPGQRQHERKMRGRRQAGRRLLDADTRFARERRECGCVG